MERGGRKTTLHVGKRHRRSYSSNPFSDNKQNEFNPKYFDLYRVEAVIQAAGAESVLYCAIAKPKEDRNVAISKIYNTYVL